MINTPNGWLTAGALLSAIAALLHVAIILGGPRWYRFFGAGETMARMAQAGRMRPTVITAAIAMMLLSWSVCALAGAGQLNIWLGRPLALPGLKWVLSGVTAIYLVRGLVGLPMGWLLPAQVNRFWIVSSLICLVFGLIHLQGLIQVWGAL
jgi:intracellular septation protein A